MGAAAVFSSCRTCCCCLCCCNRNQYQPIDNNELLIKSSTKYFHVVDGCAARTKFTTKYIYDDRFIWIDITDRTIHVSHYMSKSREHKEASLLDVIKINKILPNRCSNKKNINIDCCITIEFERGGSIDLLFENSTLRDSWFEVLSLSCPQTFKSPMSSSIELQNIN
jgi:hypothetical protein